MLGAPGHFGEAELEPAQGLSLIHISLRRWRERFLAQRSQIQQLGFDERFMHIWEFYLAYCEAAFATGNTNVMQFTLRRPA